MRRMRMIIVGLAIASSVALGGSVARAATPAPVPGSPSCAGTTVATENHSSGYQSRSGNPHASTGPGAVLGSVTHVKIQALRD
ncbi:MAG TPA: hypothetical protein VF221_00180, partial [Chloroflexota bacterium]